MGGCYVSLITIERQRLCGCQVCRVARFDTLHRSRAVIAEGGLCWLQRRTSPPVSVQSNPLGLACHAKVCMCGGLCGCGCICIICISARRVQREILSSDSSDATSAVTLLCLLSKSRKCGEMSVERGGERGGENIGRDRIGLERQNEISVVCHVCSESVMEPLWSLSSNEKTVLLISPTRLVLCGSVWVPYTHTHTCSLSLVELGDHMHLLLSLLLSVSVYDFSLSLSLSLTH